ncbi:RING finger domain and kelch repeat-containing protein DDB_G0271372-like [Mytilus edulis]|uniref:RING finger domain and kelch repeat-containing protein DDB_G0271372-like n=1 Tax=Mytilus edulis TaxID=6550 RepID=UPI0039F06840
MADNMLECEIKAAIGKALKPLRCRYHETEEYTIFCKGCKDFMCFKCLGQLHQKHDLCQLQDAEEDIRKEMEVLLLNGKYSEQLTALGDKLSDIQKKLLQDEERLNCEIKTSVVNMKAKLDSTEERLLSELHNTFESYHITLRKQETNVKDLQSDITNLEVNKLNEFEFSHIINILSEINLCSVKCDKIANRPIPGFKPTMEFSFGNLIENSSGKCDTDAISLSACSDISTQTDVLEDSETKWFDADDFEEDNLIESSSDEVTDKYPITFQLKQDLTLVRKIIPISEQDAWILANRQLLKIVNHSLDDIVYANNVSDFVVLKDSCVLILSEKKSFIMKLLTDGRLVRFANIGESGRTPHCFCISEDDLLVIYLESNSGVQGMNL